MNRLEFMGELERLLSDIPDSEKMEALEYYNDYFNDAGVENEQDVIASLGTPEKVAAIIKDGLNDHEGTEGEFTEKGFSAYEKKNQDEIANRGMSSEDRGFQNKKKMSGGMIALLVIVCIFALPILGPIGIAILSTLFGIICTVVGVLIAVLVAGAALCVAGVATFIAGIATMFVSPIVGLLVIGVSLLLLGIGILLTILGVWILGKGVPPMVRGIVNLCRKPFNKKEAV